MSSGNTWFTADLHFNHKNIIDLVSRPFNSLNKMHQVLIENWNSRVKPEDRIYIVGDLYWGKDSEQLRKILAKLNGEKFLILGNHDEINPFKYVDLGIKQVSTWMEVGRFIMVHDPARSVENKDRFHLCGHVHDLFQVQGNVINVGVDVWNFKPISMSKVISIVECLDEYPLSERMFEY